jgi:uncharacterized iron-regulated protein
MHALKTATPKAFFNLLFDRTGPFAECASRPVPVVTSVRALVAQTASIQRAMTVLGLSETAIEGSDSLDAPAKVFQ